MIEVGDPVEFDWVLFYKRTRGDGAKIEMEARGKPKRVGQVVDVRASGQYITVIWEDGRKVEYGPVPYYSQLDLLRET